MRLNCSYFYKNFARAFWNWVKFWMFSPGDRLMCTNKTCFAGVVIGPKPIFLIKNSFSFVSIRKTMNSNISVIGSDFDSRCKPGVFEVMQKFYYGQTAKNCTDWLMLLLLLRKKESSSFAGSSVCSNLFLRFVNIGFFYTHLTAKPTSKQCTVYGFQPPIASKPGSSPLERYGLNKSTSQPWSEATCPRTTSDSAYFCFVAIL